LRVLLQVLAAWTSAAICTITPDQMRTTDLEVGASFGPSEWLTIDQLRIDRFADATNDQQWIHTDPRRAAEGPFGTTVAHGFLTLSLLSPLFDELVAFEDAALSINYGLDRVRFPAPVPVWSRVRATFAVESVTQLEGGIQATFAARVEREGSEKPVCVATMIFRFLR
jgi:acyl dehydratase